MKKLTVSMLKVLKGKLKAAVAKSFLAKAKVALKAKKAALAEEELAKAVAGPLVGKDVKLVQEAAGRELLRWQVGIASQHEGHARHEPYPEYLEEDL